MRCRQAVAGEQVDWRLLLAGLARRVRWKVLSVYEVDEGPEQAYQA